MRRNGPLTFTIHHLGTSRVYAISKGQKAADTGEYNSTHQLSSSSTSTITNHQTDTYNLSIMAPTSCANCNTANTQSHPLKLCGACKTVGYCDRACQKANWKVHKSACHQSESKKAKEQAAQKEIEDTMQESLLADGNLQLGETISLPHDSYVFKDMPSTSELSRGYQKVMVFPPSWPAKISHLSAREQEETKNRWADQLEATVEASMTPEEHEAQRLQAIEVGKVQERFYAKMAAKKAAKDAENK